MTRTVSKIASSPFIAPHEYEELRKLKGMRRRFLTAELSDEEVERIAAARMDPRYDHLNSCLIRISDKPSHAEILIFFVDRPNILSYLLFSDK
jgi:hypothetical protein